MNVQREEIRTGLLVVFSLTVFVGTLIYLGSPGVFVPQKKFRIYFNNASGLRPGAQVLLAGRKIGEVRELYSPVPENERPDPKLEALVEVEVEASARVYKQVRVQMAEPRMLSEMVIDFANGVEASGLAPHGHSFIGEKPPGLAEAVPAVLEKIDPVLQKATATFDSLQKTADNLTRLTNEDADLPVAISEFKTFGSNLKELSGTDGPLRKSLINLEVLTGDDGRIAEAVDNMIKLTGPDSSLAKASSNAERFTGKLASNPDIEVTLRNFRRTSERLNGTVETLGDQFTTVGRNLGQASDTLKHQPWRLIWPTTKKYPEERLQTPKPSVKARPAKVAPGRGTRR